MTPPGRLLRRLSSAWPRTGGSMADPDERLAVRSAAAMNAVICVVLAIVAVADRRAWPLAVGVMALAAGLVAAGLLLLARAGRSRLWLALAGDIAALAIIAGAIAGS